MASALQAAEKLLASAHPPTDARLLTLHAECRAFRARLAQLDSDLSLAAAIGAVEPLHGMLASWQSYDASRASLPAYAHALQACPPFRLRSVLSSSCSADTIQLGLVQSRVLTRHSQQTLRGCPQSTHTVIPYGLGWCTAGGERRRAGQRARGEHSCRGHGRAACGGQPSAGACRCAEAHQALAAGLDRPRRAIRDGRGRRAAGM